MMVARALISGVTPFLIDENTYIGRVVLPGPLTKEVITKLSIDRVNDSNQAATSDEEICGKVTKKKVFMGRAPKSIAASSME